VAGTTVSSGRVSEGLGGSGSAGCGSGRLSLRGASGQGRGRSRTRDTVKTRVRSKIGRPTPHGDGFAGRPHGRRREAAQVSRDAWPARLGLPDRVQCRGDLAHGRPRTSAVRGPIASANHVRSRRAFIGIHGPDEAHGRRRVHCSAHRAVRHSQASAM
jgi:hypothetical protein